MKYIFITIRFFRANGPEIQHCAKLAAELGAALLVMGRALASELKAAKPEK